MEDDAYSVYNNVIKWSGFYDSEEEAQEHLEKKLVVFALKKNIISAKKELQVKKGSDITVNLVYRLKELQRTTDVKKKLLYKFTVVVAAKV